ncbi:hypothetical protein NEOLEDRAFT_1174185 [Neolentinus lepideus HHB14362 ss-1]|uniref:GDP-fucose protein O-fucosyltransferase n=1 Tax=Neolentinus lepideus HHB14362 ss-1 TaxID=1314782 RepID=A0A165W851_9AGAM|nr:hypothetical protein NEOLEDRAFT_1174185 [Neolentinus lepideus HHB14362 ss-1]
MPDYKYHHVRTDSEQPFLDDYKSRKSESDLDSPLSYHHRRSSVSSPSLTKRRRWLFAACALLSVASITALALLFILTNREPPPSVVEESEDLLKSNASQCAQPSQSETEVIPPWDKRNVLVGAPTRSFRDNLRSDHQYITSWFSAGWTNDVMTAANLIYLGLITDRTPIVPPFTPSHIGGDVPPIPFGEVFNVSRLAQALGTPVLEWHDVKEVRNNSELGWSLPFVPTQSGPEGVEADGEIEGEQRPPQNSWEAQQDVVGCWEVWESVQSDEHFARRSAVPQWLGLDISYTQLPPSIKLVPDYVHDQHTTFWALAQYSYPEGRADALARIPDGGAELTHPAQASGETLDPDEQMMCLDYLYYVAAHTPFEFEKDFSPAWREVATHMHWTDRLQEITNGYIRKAFELPEGADIPPYIAIHVRHGDFRVYCHPPPESALDPSCFAPLSAIRTRVFEIQAELLAARGVSVPASHVLMTSDEGDAEWWAEVAAMGWRWIDHGKEGTAGRLGRWYPVLVDAVVQSGGAGFVGTDRSTMSLMARRRAEDWQGSVTRTVRWGSLGADEH